MLLDSGVDDVTFLKLDMVNLVRLLYTAWFLKIAFVHDVGILVYVCVFVCVCLCVCLCTCVYVLVFVCLSVPEAINN